MIKLASAAEVAMTWPAPWLAVRRLNRRARELKATRGINAQNDRAGRQARRSSCSAQRPRQGRPKPRPRTGGQDGGEPKAVAMSCPWRWR
jgi:hypothetical protein